MLVSGDNMTLQDTIREANALETVERQMSVFAEKSSTSVSDDINQIKSRSSRRTRQQKCTRCGSSEDKRNHKCPALEVICHKCNCYQFDLIFPLQSVASNATNLDILQKNVRKKKFASVEKLLMKE
nr:unnamed protein product [Callosobruchus analis]